MNTKLLRFQRLSALLILLIISSFLFTNCSSDDDSPERPAPVVEEFEEVEDLEPVEDIDPEVKEPETGEVEQPEATGNIIDNVLGATESGEITEETKEALAEVSVFAETLPEEVSQVAAVLDEAAIDNILDSDQELPESLEELQASMDALPAEIAKLLPAIAFTPDFGEMAVKSNLGEKIIIDFTDSDLVSQVLGSCAEANRNAYDTVIEDLTAQRDANQIIIDDNYTRRVAEADTRYGARVSQQGSKYAENQATIKTTILQLLEAATNAEALGSTEIAGQLRTLALLYTVSAKTALAVWDAAVQQLLVDLQTSEKEVAATLKSQKSTEVNAAFSAAKAQADGLLANALANCHDQGAGN